MTENLNPVVLPSESEKSNADRKRDVKASTKKDIKLKLGFQMSETSVVEESKIMPQNEDDQRSEKSKKDGEVDEEKEASDQSVDKGGKSSATIKVEKPKDKPAATKPKKWEKRWVMQPNVLDLNRGEIWVQKWVTVESAQESRDTINKILIELEEAEKQQAVAQADSKGKVE